MSRVAFVSDIDTPLGNRLVRLYLRDQNRVFATHSGMRDEISEQELNSLRESAGGALIVEEWNRASPIGATNMILEALNSFEEVDELVLIGCPSATIPALHEASFETIERTVDRWIKGSLFLLKAVLVRYLDKGKGTVALINPKKEQAPNPLEEAVRRSFMGLAHSLLTSYGDKGISVVAFESSVDLAEEYAAFIYKSLSETRTKTTGRRLRFRRGIFSNLTAESKSL